MKARRLITKPRSWVERLGVWRSGVWILAWVNIGSGLTFVKQGAKVSGPGLKVLDDYWPFHLEGYGVFLVLVAVLLVVGTQRVDVYSSWFLWFNMMVYLGQVFAVILGYFYYGDFSPGFWIWSGIAAFSYVFKKITPKRSPREPLNLTSER